MPTRRILLLHLAPGAAIVVFYLATAPLFVRMNFPVGAALLAGFLLVGMPLQLAIMRNKAIRFREPMRAWLFAALVIGLFCLALALYFGTAFVSDFLAAKVFFWAPRWVLPGAEAAEHPHRSLVLLTLLAQLLIDGVINPIVEEFYFRGFLLPRLEKFGWFAPAINTALFTLGHFWQPYNYVSIFVTVLPSTYVTWWRRNFYPQLVIHCLANSLGATLALISFFRA